MTLNNTWFREINESVGKIYAVTEQPASAINWAKGIHLPTQSRVNKATMTESAKINKGLIEVLKSDQWVIHFDGRFMNDDSRQGVVVKNKIGLAELTLKNGRADAIFPGLKELFSCFPIVASNQNDYRHIL